MKEGLWFKQNMPHVLEVKRKWESRKYDAYDPHDFPNGTDWIIELCERGHKYDWEGFCVGTPYPNSVHGLDKDVIISDECEHSEMIDDCLPLVGIDTHTRPGGMAIGVLRKQCTAEGTEKFLSNDYSMTFFCEGWLLRKKQSYDKDIWWVMMSNEPDVPDNGMVLRPEAREYFELTYKERLDGLRRWVMNGPYLEVMNAFRRMYNEAPFYSPA